MTGPLEHRLAAAHKLDDKMGLVGLYCEAADTAPSDAARSFFLTHAYVFALETADARTENLRHQLIALGAEPPDDT